MYKGNNFCTNRVVHGPIDLTSSRSIYRASEKPKTHWKPDQHLTHLFPLNCPTWPWYTSVWNEITKTKILHMESDNRDLWSAYFNLVAQATTCLMDSQKFISGHYQPPTPGICRAQQATYGEIKHGNTYFLADRKFSLDYAIVFRLACLSTCACIMSEWLVA